MLAVVTMLLGVMAAPAAADEPVVFKDSVTFDASNPCTEDDHTVTINLLVSIHEHPDEFIVRVRRTGTTSDGYVMAHGKETFTAYDGVEMGEFEDPWRNLETGDSFVAQGRFLSVDGEVLVDDFRLVCTS